MKICFVLSLLELGGSERKVVNISNTLSEQGYEVEIIILRNHVNNDLKAKISEEVKITCCKNTLSILKNIIIKKFDVIFLVNGFPCFFSIPFRLINIKSKIYYLNNTTKLPVGYSRTRLLWLKFSSYFVDLIVYGSKAQKKHWSINYGFKKKSSVVYNGVDTDYFDFVQTRENDQLILVMTSQIRKEKNHLEAMKATKCLIDEGYNIKLNVVGKCKDDCLYKNILSYIKDNELNEHINLLGETSDVRHYLKESDIFLLTSDSVETFSNSCLEAMSTGLPAIISDVGGAREMINSGVSGYIYSVGDVEALISKVKCLHDFETRTMISNNARKEVKKRFSYNNMINSYVELIS